jgi:hypothetical protein
MFTKLVIVIIGFGLIFIFLAGSFAYYTFFTPEYKVHLPYKEKGEFSDLVITNVRAAKDPTFDQLLTFLKDDDTDTRFAGDPDFGYGRALVQLHDNAERQGIRCGIVVVKFAAHPGELYGMEVFNTVDYGQVLVDCTGGPDGSGGECIVHRDKGDLFDLVFSPIEGTPVSFLEDTENMSKEYSVASRFSLDDKYTW